MERGLYDQLVPWYFLVDPTADHAGEAASYRQAFESAGVPTPATLLDVGAGAGNNAWHLKPRFRCTLTDISEPMLALSRTHNPECEHIVGDMRTLRLERSFDAVLMHDAVMYMTTEPDLAAAIMTAWVHTKPGGVAIFAPDCFKDDFHESSEIDGNDDGDRSLRMLTWSWDPDPSDDTFVTEYAFLMRNGADVRAVHDRHVEGLFARSTWTRLLEATGFTVTLAERALDDEGEFDQIFVAKRPA